MKRVVLLGVPGAKRTVYLEKAAHQAGICVNLVSWEEWRQNGFPNVPFSEEMFLKCDPPGWDSCMLKELSALTGNYRKQLETLSQLPVSAFLNPPHWIAALLDKRQCKKRLAAAKLPVTEEIQGTVSCAQELLQQMRACGLHQVFIKPVYGSGAAGVAAFRYRPRTGNMTLYTCAYIDPASKELVNTKRLRRFENPFQILSLLDAILSMGCIVERWYAKAQQDGYSYDLRAVFQDGKLDFLLARLSKGPITNLHLNNHPLEESKFSLSLAVREEITELCRRAVACYPGLRSAGIDLLLERGSKKPRIIEMNGQGDLIYQDIYGENRIYCHQAEMMKAWLSK